MTAALMELEVVQAARWRRGWGTIGPQGGRADQPRLAGRCCARRSERGYSRRSWLGAGVIHVRRGSAPSE
jgi:hypothetical protein